MEEMQIKLEKYHKTLLKEREIKNQLILKLKKIHTLTSNYKRNKFILQRNRSKANGIPFSMAKISSKFNNITIDKNTIQNADLILTKIHKIVC